MTKCPRLSRFVFTDGQVARPEEGWIILAYSVHAGKDDGTNYMAHCTSTWCRHGHEDWRLVQYHQTPQA